MGRDTTSWAHIVALQTVFLQYGCPFSYYVDSHSIFRFVQGRDSLWREHHLLTDQVDPQWKQVLDDCGVKVTYALSPQAKGKIERPYRWIQDRLVRTCVRGTTSLTLVLLKPSSVAKSSATISTRFIPPPWRFLISDFKEL